MTWFHLKAIRSSGAAARGRGRAEALSIVLDYLLQLAALFAPVGGLHSLLGGPE
jgi:hypothetical protein